MVIGPNFTLKRYTIALRAPDGPKNIYLSLIAGNMSIASRIFYWFQLNKEFITALCAYCIMCGWTYACLRICKVRRKKKLRNAAVNAKIVGKCVIWFLSWMHEIHKTKRYPKKNKLKLKRIDQNFSTSFENIFLNYLSPSFHCMPFNLFSFSTNTYETLKCIKYNANVDLSKAWDSKRDPFKWYHY